MQIIQNSLNHFSYIKALTAVGVQTIRLLGMSHIVPDSAFENAYLIFSHLMQGDAGHTYIDSMEILRTEQPSSMVDYTTADITCLCCLYLLPKQMKS